MTSKSDIADWNRIAATYAEGVQEGPGFPYIHDLMLELLGDVTGLRVLDVGCGQGWLSGRLLESGADVTGVDGSAELLRRARHQYSGVSFLEMDLAEGLTDLRDSRFDIVVSHLALMDVPELQTLFNDVARTIQPDGRFVYCILHPAFWNQKSHLDEESGEWHKRVGGYLDHEVWRVETFGGHNHYHRSISYYTEALRTAGMVVSRLLEPRHLPGGRHAEIPSDFISKFPLYLVVEAVTR